MTIDNEELMQKLVRTGMIMRHIDGEAPKCRRGHGPHGHGPGEGATDGERARHEGERCCDHVPHGHGSDGPHHHGRGKGHRRGQARVLTMVSMQEGINQKDLAFLLGIRPQTLGEMLQKLEGRGLVERKKSESDGRAVEVTLTDEGRVRAAEIAERRKLAAADMFGTLTEDEKEQLAAILDKLEAELEKHRPHRPGKHGEGKPQADEA